MIEDPKYREAEHEVIFALAILTLVVNHLLALSGGAKLDISSNSPTQ